MKRTSEAQKRPRAEAESGDQAQSLGGGKEMRPDDEGEAEFKDDSAPAVPGKLSGPFAAAKSTPKPKGKPALKPGACAPRRHSCTALSMELQVTRLQWPRRQSRRRPSP